MKNSNEYRANTTTTTLNPIPPVWLRIPEAVRVSGLCRSSIYNLITNKKVKSFTNKIQPDSQRGTRLISYSSLVEYLEKEHDRSLLNAATEGGLE